MRRLRGLHYAWVVVAVAFAALLMAAGFRSTAGVLIVPLQNDFGWSRASISLAVSINLLLYGLCAPFAAGLVDRFGVRRTVAAALALVAVGAGLTSLMDAPWQLDALWGVVVGSATGAIGVTLAAVVATRWFVARRGLVTGVLTASNATGQLVFLPLLAWIASTAGWRFATATVALAAVGVVLPLVVVFMRERPADLGLRPYGALEDEAPLPPRANPLGETVRALAEASRKKDFWLLSGSFFVCGATTTGLIGTHLIPAAMDHGMSEVAAASLLAVIGVFDIVGTTASGWLTDRYSPRWLLFWYYTLRGASLLALPFVFGSQHFGLVLFVIVYGLDWVATVPPTVALTAAAFGRERTGVVFGWIFASHQLGAAAAAWGGGLARGWEGNYRSTFIAAGLFCFVASSLVTRIGRSRGGAAWGEVARPLAEVE